MTDKHFNRRNLPHLYFREGIYFITFRLADSLPSIKVAEIKAAIESLETNDDEKFKRLLKKYDDLLDSGLYGKNHLANPKVAEICKYTLNHPDGKDYKLICYCIMPNHIHLVFELIEGSRGISKIMQSIKRISARKSNQILNRTGKFWQDESYDRLVRDDKELYFIIKYVLLNPVNAGLIDSWSNWKHSYCRSEYLVL
ncbi:MAG TPA: transposase [Ignavibacteriaceae bacterium]|nr:transposase [Ignavibacteriaceae bacterium]